MYSKQEYTMDYNVLYITNLFCLQIIHKQTGLCVLPESLDPERGARLVLEDCDLTKKKKVCRVL